jgi:hypothetical protein
MRKLISILLLFPCTWCFGQQEKQIAFKKTDYPASKFLLTSDTSKFGEVQIITTMVTPKGGSRGFLCRSWLTIRGRNKVLKQKFYQIEPVGGCSGLFVPSVQPLDNYFIISKFGDYEGETLLVDTTGKLIELTGGSFSVSPDKKYLFAIWNSDLSGITIFDLTKRKTILSKEIEGDKEYRDVYFQDGTYYVTYFDENTVGILDIRDKDIRTSSKPKGFLKKMSKLRIYNDVQALTTCNCGRK